jgi:asparagine synthase (glutamine-hydrolysing)
MCGIAGIVDFENNLHVDEKILRQMAEALKYRGPDQEGYVFQNVSNFSFGLAHKRLSILDLSDAGRQPMWNTEKNCVIAFNGEIYNFPSLKFRLEKEGAAFSTSSDTEVILVAYHYWGIEKMLHELEGMFAFTLVDLKRQTVYVARDRFGEKPLYYHSKNNFFAFSSDIRSFHSLGISREIDLHALGYFFSEMATPIDSSIYSEIKKIPPANYIQLTKKGIELNEYWNLNYKEKTKLNIEEAVDQTEVLLEKAVQKTLLSDVPVGCFLSGGLDSSLVSLYAAKNYSTQLKTFSVGFEYESFNELPYAHAISKQIGSEHNEIVLNPDDLSIVDELLKEYGEPFADSSAIPTYYVSKFAGKEVKVALGGDGGDEVFAGYRTYNQGLRMQQWYNKRYLHLPLTALKNLIRSEKATYLAGVMKKEPATLASALYRNMGFSQGDLKELLNDKLFFEAPKREHEQAIFKALEETDDLFDVLLHSSIKTRLVNDYLVKTDRATMFNSLELRTPFLDKELIEFCNSLPYDYIMCGGENKYITKKIAEKHFSKELIYREKQGFGIPIGHWMKNVWKNQFEEVVFEKQAVIPLNYAYIEKIWQEHLSNKKDHSHRLWIVYVFHKWIKNDYLVS